MIDDAREEYLERIEQETGTRRIFPETSAEIRRQLGLERTVAPGANMSDHYLANLKRQAIIALRYRPGNAPRGKKEILSLMRELRSAGRDVRGSSRLNSPALYRFYQDLQARIREETRARLPEFYQREIIDYNNTCDF